MSKNNKGKTKLMVHDDNNVQWNDDVSPNKLKDDLERKDFGSAGELLDLLIDDLDISGRRLDAPIAKSILHTIRNYAWFQKLKIVSEKIFEYAQDDPGVLLQIGQARIELGELSNALDLMTKLKQTLDEELEDPKLMGEEREIVLANRSESIGLIGRIYKQYYINAHPSPIEPRNYDYEMALKYYTEGFEMIGGDNLWHGINKVALLNHRERVKGKKNAVSKEGEVIAKKIIEDLNDAVQEEEWVLSNYLEAHLGLGQTKEAIKYAQKYATAADSFKIQSTLRQLKEVWMLDTSNPPGNTIIPLLTARMAELGGTSKSVSLEPEQMVNYQKVWGTTNYKSVKWILNALERAKSVARIGINKYEGSGTGFLIDGKWISDQLKDKHLLLTNAHVCTNDPKVQAQFPYPRPPEDLIAAFLGTGDAQKVEEIEFEQLIWTSAPSDLDATLLELKEKPRTALFPELSKRDPPVPNNPLERLNILGHPMGLDLRISLQDNKVVEVGNKYVYYRTPTDPGSSGSPVFDDDWKLVALHHASSGVKKANEGIRIDIIFSAIKKHVEKGKDI